MQPCASVAARGTFNQCVGRRAFVRARMSSWVFPEPELGSKRYYPVGLCTIEQCRDWGVSLGTGAYGVRHVCRERYTALRANAESGSQSSFQSVRPFALWPLPHVPDGLRWPPHWRFEWTFRQAHAGPAAGSQDRQARSRLEFCFKLSGRQYFRSPYTQQSRKTNARKVFVNILSSLPPLSVGYPLGSSLRTSLSICA